MFNKEKKYFKDKLKGVQKMIWDLDFKKYKTLEIREEVRQTYDTKKSALENLKEKLESEKKKGKLKQEEIARIEDEVTRTKRDIERHEQQLKGFDLEVFGSKPTAEYPDGVQGIDDQIEALHELEQMLKEYISKL